MMLGTVSVKLSHNVATSGARTPSPQPKSDISDLGHLKSAELGQARVRVGEGWGEGGQQSEIHSEIRPPSPGSLRDPTSPLRGEVSQTAKPSDDRISSRPALVRTGALTLAIALFGWSPSAIAQDLIVEKKVFELPRFTTAANATIKNVRIGWEAAGALNADKSNAVLITHFFSGTSHAFGKYAAGDSAAGYWDSIIGPGKPIDTNKYYVVSSDTLVNLNANAPNVVTTGPATIDPDTGKPYGMRFPVVGIKDFVRVQKALIDSLGVRKLKAVVGASMGGFQAYEWAASYPEMVERIVPVVATPAPDLYLI